MNRRQFFQTTAGAAAFLAARRRAYAYGQSPLMTKFSQPIQGLGPTGIPVANPIKIGGVDTYKIHVGQYQQQFHPDLPASTLWGYADITHGETPNHRYLGGVIVARKGTPVKLTAINDLPSTHPLPVDTTLMGAEPDQLQNRITVHLHGGFVPWTSDGGPFSWFAPKDASGSSFLHGPSFLNGNGHPGEAEYYYPNDQSARLMWYHDHAMGITRLNAYAGIASGYILRDDWEDNLVWAKLIPPYEREIPLIIQEKTFVDGSDPNYVWGKKGDLWYPYKYEKDSELPNGAGRWGYAPDEDPPGTVTGPLPTPSAVPEFFGDTVIINGVAYPFLPVEQRHYRFRILNGSQARMFNLQLYYADSTGMEADLKRPGPAMIQIGTEGGFLTLPVKLNSPPQQVAFDTNPDSPTFGNAVRYTLLLGGAERADVIIDFSKVPAGSKLILYNDAPAPFPMGDDRNDYYTGDPDQSEIGGAPSTLAGSGPNTRTLMQIQVIARKGAPDPPTMDLLAAIALNGPQASSGQPSVPGSSGLLLAAPPLSPSLSIGTRDLTLNEDFDESGRLIQMLGTHVPNGKNSQGVTTFSRPYMDAATEVLRAGSIEIWRIFNLTGDTHPIHFHLVNVQVISRQPFDAENYHGHPAFLGPARGPDLNELGWKETVRMNPGECTTVLMKIDLPKTPFVVPHSPRTGGHEYVWHCHILEHEEHDMMRPMVVR